MTADEPEPTQVEQPEYPSGFKPWDPNTPDPCPRHGRA